ncbi:MAG: hypothetical protein SFX73_14395 [Kofleriaceae bacterium]|nr:hypothetical protein [Kofleriaceae bacterium]
MSRFAAVASSLFAVAAGCGDDGGFVPPDAPPTIDDAPMVDARPSGPVTVTTKVRCCTLTPGTVQAGVTVAVVQPDGTLGETGVSDAAGQVSFTNVQLGASITAIYPEDADANTDISTIVGVKPGDSLTFGENYYQPQPAGQGSKSSVTVTWPDTYNYYQVWAGACGSWGTYGGTAAFERKPGCDSATTPVVVVARDNNWDYVATAYLPAADFTGSTVNVESWTPNRTDFAVSISGVEAPMEVDFESVAAYPHAHVGIYNSGAEPTNGTVSANLTVSATAVATKTFAYLWRGQLEGRQEVYSGGVSPLALTAPTLPWLSAAIVNIKTGKAGWFQTDGNADGAVFYLNWQHYDEGADLWRDYEWNLVLPPGLTELELESPVTALAALLPDLVDDVDSPEVRLVDLSSTADYDAFRQLPEWRMTDVAASVIAGDEASASQSISADGGEGAALRRVGP